MNIIAVTSDSTNICIPAIRIESLSQDAFKMLYTRHVAVRRDRDFMHS